MSVLYSFTFKSLPPINYLSFFKLEDWGHTTGGRSNGAAKNSKTAMPGTDQKNINLVLN